MSFVEMDLGTRTGRGLDSESILPDFPPIHEHTSQNEECHSEMRTRCTSSIENMDDTVLGLDVEIKEEVGELFMGKSTDEEHIQTVFPSGLILIHDQPTMTMTVSAPGSRTDTHILTYTPVYMAENGSPSYLQTSTPNTSIIHTNNSKIQFVRPAVQSISSGGLHQTVNFAPKDPLDISPHTGNHSTYSQSTQISVGIRPPLNIAPQDRLEITHRGKTSSGSIVAADAIPTSNSSTTSSFNTVERETHAERIRRQNAEKTRRARERKQQNETPEERKERLASQAERKRKRIANETEERRKARLAAHAEQKRKRIANETEEQRKARRTADAERRRKRFANETEEQRKTRLAAHAERNRKYLDKKTQKHRNERLDAQRQGKYLAGETKEQRSARLEAKAKRQRKCLANETPERRTNRLAANVARNRKRLADETPEQRIVRLARVAQCEYCEKSFAHRKLRYHMIRNHTKTEDKKFKCDQCEKTFAIQGDCKTHMLTHSKEKRFL